MNLNPTKDTMGRAVHDFRHEPVLVELIVELIGSAPPGLVLDATLGGAGHAAALLSAHPHLRLAGIDQDATAIAAAAERLAPFGDRFTLYHTRFDRLTSVVDGYLAEHPETNISGVLFDLGVSSPQFDWAERGFSYRIDGPLDMRMNPSQSFSADDLVNHGDEAELASILWRNADEKFSRRIAKSIVAHRPVPGTAALAEIVRDAIPAPARRRGGHPAKRTFQALRIAVNQELDILPRSIDDAIDALSPGGICAVLTYHSGEDRIVKERFINAADGGCTCPVQLGCQCGAVRLVKLLKPGGFTASAEEQLRNRRSVSARLRVAVKLDVPKVAA